MNGKAATMKKEINAVAGYRALMISKYFITLLLGIASFYLGIIRYAMSPFYILLMLNILPPILNYALKDYAKKNIVNRLLAGFVEDIPFQLNMLKRKYKYSRLNYFSNSISYLFALLLLCLWQYNYNITENINELIIKLPLTILATGVSLRFLGIVVYRLKFPYDLSHNKL